MAHINEWACLLDVDAVQEWAEKVQHKEQLHLRVNMRPQVLAQQRHEAPELARRAVRPERMSRAEERERVAVGMWLQELARRRRRSCRFIAEQTLDLAAVHVRVLRSARQLAEALHEAVRLRALVWRSHLWRCRQNVHQFQIEAVAKCILH